jgi:NAD(P)-dependent dehydrogenase (short-subunit alcohol dehydrogenase family)
MSKNNAYVVTGASGYLGRAMALELSRQEGSLLVLASRREVLDLEVEDPGRLLLLPGLDLSSSRDALELAGKVADFIPGSFDVINCMGRFPGYRTILEIDGDEALEIHKSNYLSVYNVGHSLLPLLKQRGGGHFVAFTSHSRYQAYPLMAAFDSAKAAVEQLVRHIANEMAQWGVVANAFSLATLATPEEFRLKPYGDHEHWLRPEEVAEIVRHSLNSPRGIINGNIIHTYAYSSSYFDMSYFSRIKTLGEP